VDENLNPGSYVTIGNQTIRIAELEKEVSEVKRANKELTILIIQLHKGYLLTLATVINFFLYNFR
jgi:hypothetical protein